MYPARVVIPVSFPRHGPHCSACNMREHCLPGGLAPEEVTQLENLLGPKRKVRRGQRLYRTHDGFESVFAIRNGFFKTDVLNEDGREQVTGFHMAGEMIGLDGIGSGRHTCDAVALEDSDVCVIPFSRLEQISREVQPLQRNIHQLMSREIVRDHGLIMLLGTMRAEERLAAFLLNMSQRFHARGWSAAEFHLRMTREEIGSYLGLKLETVSRAFSRFHEERLIYVQQKHIRILESEGLRALVRG